MQPATAASPQTPAPAPSAGPAAIIKNFLTRQPSIALAIAGILLCLFILLFVVPYSSGYGGTIIPIAPMMMNIWSAPDNADWQHGMLVPFIVLGLLWWKRAEIFTEKPAPATSGLFVLLPSLAAYWFGARAELTFLGFLAVHGILVGMIIWLFGWRVFAKLLFPLIFLGFTWPLVFLNEIIAVPLRHLMAAISAAALNMLGVGTIRVGTGLRSMGDPAAGIPDGQLFALDVADPCSGIRSLFALLMVSALYGYLTLPKWWQRAALFLAGIPLAVFGNFIRMMLLTFGTIWFGAPFAIGTLENPSAYHMAAGYAVFIAAIGGMIAAGWLLQRDWGALLERIRSEEEAAAATTAAEPGSPARSAPREDEY